MKNQKGAALIVVLSLLTISLMVGLSSMQSSQIDERLAGNYRAQSQAQMGAEEAASTAWGNIDEIVDDDWVMLSELAYSDLESLTWQDLKDDGQPGGCQSPISCYYLYVDNDGDKYLVAMGAVDDGDVAVSEPVVVFLEPDGPRYVGPSAVHLPTGLDEDADIQWPNSQPSRINGNKKFGEDGYVPAMSLFDGGDGYLSKNNILDGIDNDKTGLEAGTLESSGQLDKAFIDAIKDIYEKYIAEDKSSGLVFHENGMTLSGASTAQGLHIVLNGSVTFNGNPSLGGALVVLDVKNLEDYKDSEKSIEHWELGPTIKLRLNGGGWQGSVWYDENIVKNALSPYGYSLESFFGDPENAGGESSPLRINTWQ
ncbi:pilus assembly PilX N-terminal domain-containing protein [Halomonas sp. BM-2019]|uniref:pilus assembly PilX family protein n=1 Tax=Halomonas sp. BM-2019 TaxID=2811227 RepID=UPI001B3C1A31|nr:MAG: pilus assembly PilX N-terminal domain-containing protein [Halomonas sp. BM-2019]